MSPTVVENEACQAELDDTEWAEPVEPGKDYGIEGGTEFYIEFNKPEVSSTVKTLSSFFPIVGSALSTFQPIVGQAEGPVIGDVISTNVDYRVVSSLRGSTKRDLQKLSFKSVVGAIRLPAAFAAFMSAYLMY